MISIKNLSYAYQNHGKNINAAIERAYALRDVTIEIPDKSLMAFTGVNGSGKSTLMKLMAGRLLPTHGGIDLSSDLKGNIGYLSQQFSFDITIPVSVFEVAAMGLWRSHGLFSKIGPTDKKRIFDVLQQVGLKDCSERIVHELSGGQLQRLRFARLLISNPSLLLLDEPFNAVDERTKVELMELLVKKWEEGCTIIAALHDKALVERYFPRCTDLTRCGLNRKSINTFIDNSAKTGIH